MPSKTRHVLNDVVSERLAQFEKWGEQRHTWPEWVSILTEEVGEAATEANKTNWAKSEDEAERHFRQMRTELVQVAAVAVQIIEHIDEVIDLHYGRDLDVRED